MPKPKIHQIDVHQCSGAGSGPGPGRPGQRGAAAWPLGCRTVSLKGKNFGGHCLGQRAARHLIFGLFGGWTWRVERPLWGPIGDDISPLLLLKMADSTANSTKLQLAS